MNETPKTIGSNIERLRLARGIGQDDLAGMLNVTQSYVSQIESGARVDIKGSTIRRFAKALGVTDNDITDGVEYPPSPAERRRRHVRK